MQIGELVKTYDYQSNTWKDGVIKNIRTNVSCCSGTECEHIHTLLYDIKLSNGYVSKGHLPHSLISK